jgi:hypothetical protein
MFVQNVSPLIMVNCLIFKQFLLGKASRDPVRVQLDAQARTFWTKRRLLAMHVAAPAAHDMSGFESKHYR